MKEDKLQDLLKSIMEEKKNLNSNIPIAVKVSPDISEDQVSQISEILLEHEIKAIIVSNTSEATRDKLSNIQRHQKGGLSGKPIEEKSNILINRILQIIKREN